MKKTILAMLALFGLAACATDAPYYAPGNYQPQPWASKSFEQSKAECKAQNLQHHWLGDTYDLQAPPYKACMEKNGYRFSADSTWMGTPSGNDIPAPATQEDKAALYR